MRTVMNSLDGMNSHCPCIQFSFIHSRLIPGNDLLHRGLTLRPQIKQSRLLPNIFVPLDMMNQFNKLLY